MKYIGFALYVLIFILVGFFKPAQDFFNSSYELAPEITILVSIFYTYIVILCFGLSLFPNAVSNRAVMFESHLKMASSVMVSLGLVGTFLGLVDMISGIAAALSGGDADFAARMEGLLSAISTSLGAMSFAFMTSILGVGISAYSLVAGVFIISAYKEEDKKKAKGKQPAKDESIDQPSDIHKRIEELEKIVSENRLRNLEDEVSPIVFLNDIKSTFDEVSTQIKNSNYYQAEILNELKTLVAHSKDNEQLLSKMANDLSQLENVATRTQVSGLQAEISVINQGVSEVSRKLTAAEQKAERVVDNLKKVFG
ncbi:hypothetical protein AL542_15685 [Grimontia hollisae]|uniref:MotA/TolQ/ExbB proton channel domain-containing protein n=2 Tax=Grimontia hollisae TaxID=673 RepID=D0I6A2_GRIHO|nr:hypothetical protein [Grimontia hollisae]AMG31630.1 hypothetical protein AL542_15685 [Grimontia hollisae]EEY72171.1 hypothetical protein VHA_001269 [Grimontia hollisae CIP 101886]MDF2186004.1 hypothetical protein [Grimontia hollisae]STO45196.1 Uncharacterised protein [Grimontia hollisae]STO57777.1 Uncharacterised protein [Grimontia hollisae]